MSEAYPVKVTFVTVAYRTPDLIRTLLSGIEKLGFDFPFEYILVNNAPGDGTSEMARERFPWVKVLDAPGNVGFAGGHNIAFREARGEYIMFINPDLIVFKGEMEKLLAAAERLPKSGIVGPRLMYPNHEMQRSFHRYPKLMTPVYRRTFLGRTSWGKRHVDWYFMRDVDEKKTIDVDGIFGAACLIRHDVLKEVGFFDERYFMYFEDVDLCRRTREKGWRVIYFPDAVFVHYHTRESKVSRPWLILTNRLARAHISSAVKYFWKFRGKALPAVPEPIHET